MAYKARVEYASVLPTTCSNNMLFFQSKYAKVAADTFFCRCLSRLPAAVGDDPAHFDLVLAREDPGGDYLVLHLAQLVALAYQVATGTLESARPLGVGLLSTVLQKASQVKSVAF